ncbi:MAG: hypothetical protein COA94_08350 [Rickettsiales bacterium]|nr:MAG: hypothetical protein COA94_08350 [Rickettsiales bacterium]
MGSVGKGFCKIFGINHKKRIIIDHEEERRVNELTNIRANNKYEASGRAPGVFSDFEEALAYKDWLSQSGADNRNSPYYSFARSDSKQRTKVLGFNGHPNIYVHWEDRFDHAAYNRDMNSAELAIRQCKWEIQREADDLRSIISQCSAQESPYKKQISKLKSVYERCKVEYTALCNKNRALTNVLNEQKKLLVVKKHDHDEALTHFRQLQESVKAQYREEFGANAQDAKSALRELITAEQQRVYHKLEASTIEERTKILFGIFDNPKYQQMFQMILSLGVDQDFLAYMAVKFEKMSAFEYALEHGATVDGYFVDDATTLERILSSGKEDYIARALQASDSVLCTALSAAQKHDLGILHQLYDSDPGVFSKHDGVVGYSLTHFFALAGYIDALELAIQLDPDCLSVLTLAEESVFAVVLRSGSDEVIRLIGNNIDIELALQAFIASDNDEFLIKAMSCIELSLEIKAELLESIIYENKTLLARELFQNPDEIKQIFAIVALSGNNILAEECFQTFMDQIGQEYLDQVLANPEISDEMRAYFEARNMAAEDMLADFVENEALDNLLLEFSELVGDEFAGEALMGGDLVEDGLAGDGLVGEELKFDE